MTSPATRGHTNSISFLLQGTYRGNPHCTFLCLLAPAWKTPLTPCNFAACHSGMVAPSRRDDEGRCQSDIQVQLLVRDSLERADMAEPDRFSTSERDGKPFSREGLEKLGCPAWVNSGQTSISFFPQISQPLQSRGGVNIFCTPPPCLALSQVLLGWI